jgi:hypothetical protein
MGEAAREIPENTPRNTPPQLLATVWKKGDPSPNPGGRPKGLAAYIREQTLDGRELADFLILVVRGGDRVFCKMSDRLKAVEMLMDRAFGRVQGPPAGEDQKLKPVLDLDKLTEQELQFLENVRLGLIAISDRVRSGEAEAEPK